MPQRKQPPRWNFTAHVSRATTSPLLARSRSLSPLLRGRKEVKKICKKCIPHAAVSRFELKNFPRLGNDGGNREKVPMPLPFPSLLSWSLHPVAGSFRSQFPTASQRRQEGREKRRREETSSSIIHNSHSSSCCPLHTREIERASGLASSS